MNAEPTRNGKPAWVRWPATCVLGLVWAVAALLSWSLGGLGKGAHSVAEWAINSIEDLSA